ncbi:TldD/PmbA family protein [Patescibacteria group bacterium]|nr:TldD/PmbA family protein [Patescibacteria group bacterium]
MTLTGAVGKSVIFRETVPRVSDMRRRSEAQGLGKSVIFRFASANWRMAEKFPDTLLLRTPFFKERCSKPMESEHREFLEQVLWQAKELGAEYADCRLYPESESEEIKVENGQVVAVNSSKSAGFGVRVLVKGSWGFFASPILSKDNIKEVAERAVHSANANASLQKEKVVLAPVTAQPKGEVMVYKTKVKTDPFEVPLERRVTLLTSADEAMRQASDKVFWRISEMTMMKTRKLFASSEGVLADQTFIESGSYIQAHALEKKGGDTQRRSYPESHPYLMQRGYEEIEKMDLVRNAGRMAEEAERLLAAPYAPTGKRGIILLPSMLNLHGHETIHGFEADRILQTEWTLAGGSFLTSILSEIGSFQFGSEKVNLVADSVTEGGVGTFGWDDEGTPAQKIYLVKEGIFKGLLTSRQTVPQLNEKIGREYFKQPNGSVRAQDYGHWPVIRMINIILEPGNTDFKELKESVPEGTMMFGTNKSWSIDDVRRHFTFGTEIAWEKVGGKWEVRKNAKYYGDNLNFWRNCQAVCNEKSFWMQGIGTCGKADPLQTMHTGHGSSPAYFTNIQVGSVG